MAHCYKAIVFVCIVYASAAMARPNLPAPPHAMVVSAGKSTVLNGIPVEIREFRSRLSVEEVTEFYRREWPSSDSDPGMAITDALSPWTILSRMENRVLMTVQMQASGDGSEGILAISTPPRNPNLGNLGKGVPKMSGSSVMSDLESDDAGKEGRVVTLSNRYSVRSNANFYRQHYLGDGWTPVMDKGIGTEMHTLAFNDMGEKINIVAMRTGSGGSMIVINIETPKWLH